MYRFGLVLIVKALTFSSQNYDPSHFPKIVIKMSWKCNWMKKIVITFLAQFHDNVTKTQLSKYHLCVYFCIKSSFLKFGHIVMEKWWKCDELKLVLVFWPLSFEFSLRAKSQCQMSDAGISMSVWVRPVGRVAWMLQTLFRNNCIAILSAF